MGNSLSNMNSGETGTMTDQDGNVYRTVKIGNQLWMAENLKVTRYRNGELIPNITDIRKWHYTTPTAARCAYLHDENNVANYGWLYNWYAVIESRNIAPAGWHVPSDVEWQTLVDYLGGGSVAGGKMKETKYSHWSELNRGATNESGFSALPGGSCNVFGEFHFMGNYAAFWSSSDLNAGVALYRSLIDGNLDVYRGNNHGLDGFSVRLVRD